MLGKRLIYKRGVTIAIAVIALMTLTAGVAAAASAKAKNVEVDGGIGLVTLDLGSTVNSKFKTDKATGAIKSVQIKTGGELIFGQLGLVDLLTCVEKGKHSDGACLMADAALSGAGIQSSHNSTARLNDIVYQDEYVLVGSLKGSLKADLQVSSLTGDVLTGKTKLKIASSAAPSTYVCIYGVDPSQNPVQAPLQACQDAKGKQELGVYVVTPLGPVYIDPATGLPDPDSKAGPILVPVDLHVLDTGTFSVSSSPAKIKGKIAVSVDTNPVPGSVQGVISITDTRATFAVDEPEDDDKPKKGKKSKKGDDD